MPQREVYPSPTVTQVIFQIRFPNLFYIAAKIGDFQLKIMERFPESRLLHSRGIIIADLGPEATLQNLPEPPGQIGLRTIWQFTSPEGLQLSVTSDTLDLSSTQHKTYNAPGPHVRFRDAIEFAVSHFLEITQIPIITRIGLRYVDKCPLPDLTNEAFSSYYNSTFPLPRYGISDALDMTFAARVRRGPYVLRFVESFVAEPSPPRLNLDFDACAENLKAENYLATTDSLQELIHDEYELFIKDPVREVMRKPRE
jgi:uncharacterized protein (TIGR04255 family)